MDGAEQPGRCWKRVKQCAHGACYWFRRLTGAKKPFIAGLVLNESCNMRCEGCRVARTGREADAGREEVAAALREFRRAGVRNLAVTGGEPFFWKSDGWRLRDVVAEARRLGFLAVTVYTNGTLPFDDCGANAVFVSPHGLEGSAGGEGGKPAWEACRWNLAATRHPNVILNFTVNSRNCGKLRDVCKFAKSERGVRGLLDPLAPEFVRFGLHRPRVVAFKGDSISERDSAVEEVFGTPAPIPLSPHPPPGFGGAPFKNCPELSKLSPTSALQAHSESAKRLPCFSMQKTIVGNCQNGLTIFVLSFAAPRTFPLAGARGVATIFGTMDSLPTMDEKFSNHWKNIFQSLEKMAQVFQPLETFFPIIGKLPFCPRATRLAKTRAHFPRIMHEALETINDDELVEVTPTALRLRKYFLTDLDRRRNRNHDWTRSA